MKKLIATVFGLVVAAAALFPLVAEAYRKLDENHNEILVRDRRD